jgi:hypothetical protein
LEKAKVHQELKCHKKKKKEKKKMIMMKSQNRNVSDTAWLFQKKGSQLHIDQLQK